MQEYQEHMLHHKKKSWVWLKYPKVEFSKSFHQKRWALLNGRKGIRTVYQAGQSETPVCKTQVTQVAYTRAVFPWPGGKPSSCLPSGDLTRLRTTIWIHFVTPCQNKVRYSCRCYINYINFFCQKMCSFSGGWTSPKIRFRVGSLTVNMFLDVFGGFAFITHHCDFRPWTFCVLVHLRLAQWTNCAINKAPDLKNRLCAWRWSDGKCESPKYPLVN